MGIITKMKSGVYAIQCLVNGKSYVGSTKNLIGRKAEHFRLFRKNGHPNIYLQRAWNKYGKDAFIFVILECCPQKRLLKCEQKFMDKMNVYKCGFNLRPKAASNFGWKQSKEQRENNSRVHKGQKVSKEVGRRISDALKGRQLSKEHKKHLSEVSKGVPKSEEHRRSMSKAFKGRVGNRKGEHHTEAAKKKIGKAHKGKKLSEEHKAKLRGIRPSDFTKAKMTKAQKERWKYITEEQIMQRRKRILRATTHKERSESAKLGWMTRRAS